MEYVDESSPYMCMKEFESRPKSTTCLLPLVLVTSKTLSRVVVVTSLAEYFLAFVCRSDNKESRTEVEHEEIQVQSSYSINTTP